LRGKRIWESQAFWIRDALQDLFRFLQSASVNDLILLTNLVFGLNEELLHPEKRSPLSLSMFQPLGKIDPILLPKFLKCLRKKKLAPSKDTLIKLLSKYPKLLKCKAFFLPTRKNNKFNLLNLLFNKFFL
jgi:hypothetical protein